MIHHTTNCSSLIVFYDVIYYYYFITVYIYLILFVYFLLFRLFILFIFLSEHHTLNSPGAVGDILVFTFVNLRDSTAYTENRKYSSGSSSIEHTMLMVYWNISYTILGYTAQTKMHSLKDKINIDSFTIDE